MARPISDERYRSYLDDIARAKRRQAEADIALREAVAVARSEGVPDAAIARTLGVSRQAIAQRDPAR